MYKMSTKLSNFGLVAMFAFLASAMFFLLTFRQVMDQVNPFLVIRWPMAVILAISLLILIVMYPLLNRMRIYEGLLQKQELLEKYAFARDGEICGAMKVELSDKVLGKFSLLINVLATDYVLNVRVVRLILSNSLSETEKRLQLFESEHPLIVTLGKNIK